MSIPIHEKIERIRASEGLSQPEFADLIGISVNTLKAIVKRGSSPRFDVVEQIAKHWPNYAYWLLTGETMPPTHNAPGGTEKTIVRVLDKISNPEADLTELAVKPEWLTQLYFVQSMDEKNDLYCFLEVKATASTNLKHCILISGNLNFCSDDKGCVGLARLAGFLDSIGRSDLIKSSKMLHVFSSDLTRFLMNSEIAEEALAEPDIGTAKWKRCVHMNFTKWRSEGVEYAPKYTWKDMVD